MNCFMKFTISLMAMIVSVTQAPLHASEANDAPQQARVTRSGVLPAGAPSSVMAPLPVAVIQMPPLNIAAPAIAAPLPAPNAHAQPPHHAPAPNVAPDSCEDSCVDENCCIDKVCAMDPDISKTSLDDLSPSWRVKCWKWWFGISAAGLIPSWVIPYALNIDFGPYYLPAIACTLYTYTHGKDLLLYRILQHRRAKALRVAPAPAANQA